MSKLEINNISITAEEKDVVRDVSLTVSSGELHVLMGANGSGKSSLARGVMGHPKFTITAGALELDGEDITHLRPDEKANKGVFLSMQHLPEIEGVTLANFLYKAYKNQKDEELSILDFRKKLEETASTYGIDAAFLSRDLNVGFSGGEKKLSEMLQIAILEPKFAILDELDSGVDVDGLGKIIALLEHLITHGVGILLISHNKAVLDKLRASQVSVIRDGVIVETGGEDIIAKISAGGFKSLEQ
jgi:Fe-S cluster assembly ATP-binding protein